MLDFHIYDVFTDRPFSGNPLAVVTGADGLSTAQMQVIARQFNLSETIFVQSPRDPAHTARVRIFLPKAEIPFAGHPTIGCALHLSGGENGRIVLEEQAGLVPVTIADGLAEFVAPALPALTGEAPTPVDVAAALGLAVGQIGFGAHRPAMASAGNDFIFVPLRDLEALAQARPRGEAFEALTRAAPKLYAYAPEGDGFRARMFAPANGVPEDPATGSASATLPALLLAAGRLGEGENRIALRQGVEMGRPSEIGLTVQVGNGAITEVRISGRAAKVAEGRITIPEVH
ncbi:PhzF family phenazine biosynthesis protein [Paracoccus zhejiangensis]|uniref:PhzF family phenazine biosynthesis protein n=1 Tax=Paracoccus zhejiangensis TaxID=1077935 RepID=A0A2H5ETX7_9RHOB|nr:PhzF family phenazine biosynthesis protein [Paracoccus zhejiangensis]AUH62756.1 PhzF family phenazine biosynthesis protein [Paracoccus zhejiangensis]